MSQLLRAWNDHTRSTTTNGMDQLVSSGELFTDLFFNIGSSRGHYEIIYPALMRAARTDLDSTVRILLWVRDVRGGAGERELFRDAIRDLVSTVLIPQSAMISLVNKIPEVGRWDDLLSLFSTPAEDVALHAIQQALIIDKNAMCAKWMPREKSSNSKSAYKIRKYMGLTPRGYRKMLSHLSNTVETEMCAGDWDSINFSHVPSGATSKYRCAFIKHQPQRYEQWTRDLADPDNNDVKVNAAAIFPYTIIEAMRNTSMDSPAVNMLNEQWNSLPNYMEGSTRRVMPVVDVSGSMGWEQISPRSRYTPLDIAVSLGLYLSERNESIFKDQFITFSSEPEMQKISGDLRSRLMQMEKTEWGGSTDIAKVFDVMLNAAVQGDIDQNEMPTDIVILSDMQFDSATHTSANSKSQTAMEVVKSAYTDAGYIVPNVIFWNLLMADSGVPISHHDDGGTLVSGFSPSMMKSVLVGQTMTPFDTMMLTIGDDRYNWK